MTSLVVLFVFQVAVIFHVGHACSPSPAGENKNRDSLIVRTRTHARHTPGFQFLLGLLITEVNTVGLPLTVSNWLFR